MQRRFHFFVTLVYALALAALYHFEISVKWGYLGFPKSSFGYALLFAIFTSSIFGATLPKEFDTRGLLLSVLHYAFFVPSLILMGASEFHFLNFIALLITILILSVVSGISLRPIRIVQFPRFLYIATLLLLIGFTLALLIFYNRFSSFNLNLFEVYEFRREAASQLPALANYLFSGVSKVVAPLSLILGIKFKSRALIVLSSFLVIFLFGMTQHKSVLFLTVAAVLLYTFYRRFRDARSIGYLFVLVVTFSIVEIAFLRIVDSTGPAFLSSYIIRRGLFLPPLLDSFYLDFFSENLRVYWSTSRFGMGLADNPYGTTVPFLIGREFFGVEGMSANTGVIGSGYAHAGLLGVALYAFLMGVLLALLQAYGNEIGHPIVSSASFAVFASTMISADLTTAILTHGLALLVLLLAIFPARAVRSQRIKKEINVSSLHDGPYAHRHSHTN